MESGKGGKIFITPLIIFFSELIIQIKISIFCVSNTSAEVISLNLFFQLVRAHFGYMSSFSDRERKYGFDTQQEAHVSLIGLVHLYSL